ncbi:hypothetical protein CDAR_185131 [Caerostris darwini]|uniref:Uncharacterized protein n=1 Tax=Caerostris darwini TaxID=1538125 RepID=A0AAV4SMK8_9ARAC|nr:hypothetical protein CDAR_185131 [Caerostris darwini]
MCYRHSLLNESSRQRPRMKRVAEEAAATTTTTPFQTMGYEVQAFFSASAAPGFFYYTFCAPVGSFGVLFLVFLDALVPLTGKSLASVGKSLTWFCHVSLCLFKAKDDKRNGKGRENQRKISEGPAPDLQQAFPKSCSSPLTDDQQ